MKTLILILTILVTLNVNAQSVIYWKSIDTNQVKSYLLQSFNELRVKYGKSTVFSKDSLNKVCELYSKKLVANYKHSNITENNSEMECISSSSFFYFHRQFHSNEPIMVNPKDVNTNKMVSDIVINIFTLSKSHMELLLGDYKVFGFGVTIKDDDTFYVVIRGY